MNVKKLIFSIIAAILIWVFVFVFCYALLAYPAFSALCLIFLLVAGLAVAIYEVLETEYTIGFLEPKEEETENDE